MSRLLTLLSNNTYIRQFMNTRPIAYFPMLELTGTVAVNYGTLGIAANGAYSGPTLAQIAAPGGGLAPSFDGSNDYVNIYSPALVAAWNGALGSVSKWLKVSGASDWSDGIARFAIRLRADAANFATINKSTTASRMSVGFWAGTEMDSINISSITPTDWFHVVFTWNKAADRIIAYYNGAAVGAPLTTVGTWAGALAADTTIIGCDDTGTPANGWKGSLSHDAIYDRELSATEVSALYNGGL